MALCTIYSLPPELQTKVLSHGHCCSKTIRKILCSHFGINPDDMPVLTLNIILDRKLAEEANANQCTSRYEIFREIIADYFKGDN